jgi:hypothetical protein
MESLRLVHVLELEKAVLPRPLTGGAQMQFIQAAQRCLQCRSKSLCDEVVRERAAVCLRHFCPNTRYIEALRAA